MLRGGKCNRCGKKWHLQVQKKLVLPKEKAATAGGFVGEVR